MKFGVISDIHGNIKALDAVLKELQTKKIDKIICLGDFIGGAAKSEEVVQRIIQMKDKCICVRGNREKYIIEGMPLIVHDEKIRISEEQLDRNEWIKNHLSKTSIEYIYNLPTENIFNVEGKKIYICHYPMKKDGSFKKHIKEANLKENEEMFLGISADLYLYGHTHKVVFNKSCSKVYINPGTLGCPGKTNNASYGFLEINDNEVRYNQLFVEYDVEKVVEEINRIAFPGYKNVLKVFYGIDYIK